MNAKRPFSFVARFLISSLACVAVTFGVTTARAGALNFSGTGAYVSVADASDLDMTSTYTLEAWVYPSSFTSLAGIISKFQTAGANGYAMRLTSTSPYSGLEGDGVATANGLFVANTWYHVAIVNSGGSRSFYVNGVLQSVSGTPIGIQANADALTIGADYLAAPRYFTGAIDEVRLWNVARSSTDIAFYRTNALTGVEAGLVAYYRFDEGTGVVAADRKNLHPGALVNMTSANWTAGGAPINYPYGTLTLAEGVNNTAVTWTGQGNAAWSAGSPVNHDGFGAARSGTILDSQSSAMVTTLEGPGTLGFWWSVSSEPNFDFLSVIIDGVEQPGKISGNISWTQGSVTIPAGTHTVGFKYAKDSSGVAYSDAAYVDEVVYTPDLSTSVDNVTQTWTTSGHQSWAGQLAVSHDGVDAAASGTILDGQTSTLQTTVTGPITAVFWWKVSSEANYDWLTFAIDGVAQPGRIAGEVGWTQVAASIPSGSHTLTWTYSKDGSASTGLDKAWVDQVLFGSAPTISGHPSSLAVNQGQAASFTVTATGNSLAYQWRKDGNPISGATGLTYTIASAQSTDAATYTVVVTNLFGSQTSSGATLTVYTPPLIQTHPASLTKNKGETATFTVTATGPSLSYFWRKNGTFIPGATASSYTIASAQLSDAAGYSVTVSNMVSTTTSSTATLTVNYAPAITLQPVGGAYAVGNTVSLSTAATGQPAPTFQWYLNNIPLAGGTGSTLTINSFTIANAGSYKVVASNSVSTAASSNAIVSVTGTPRIVSGPDSYFGSFDDTVTLRVTATGASVYQWYRHGVAIAGATNSVLTLPRVGRIAASDYRVAVGNGITNVWSASAFVVLGPGAGSMVAWGDDSSGQNLFGESWTNLAALSVGMGHVLGLRADGSILAIGDPTSGQTSVPSGFGPWVAAAAGGSHNLALRTNGLVVAWGGNASGQTNVPASASNTVAVAAGAAHSLALSTNGVVTAWGGADAAVRTVPADATNISAIAASAAHSVALRRDGTLFFWGIGVEDWSTPPASATNLTGIAAGGQHIVALRADGTVVAWGNNDYGQTAVPVSATNIVAVSAGDAHSLALRADGTVIAWGAGASGATGTWPDYAQSTVPESLGACWLIGAGGFQGTALALEAPAITGLASRVGFAPGSTVVLRPVVTGSRPLSWQWSRNGVALVTETNATLNLGTPAISGNAIYSLTVSNLAGVAASSDVSLEVESKPVLTGTMAATNMVQGSSIAWTLQGAGTLPITYRWFRGTLLLDTTETPALALDNVETNQTGAYSLVASNQFGTTTVGPAQVNVYQPVTITGQPDGTTVLRGGIHALAVEAAGTAPLSYQWYRGGFAVSGATNNYYRPSTASPSDSGSYYVTVSNRYSSATSQTATVTVMDPPSLTETYTRTNQFFGQAYSLSVTPGGTGPFTYRWFQNGQLVDAPSTNVLTLPSLSYLDDGDYSVEISNAVGTIQRTFQNVHVVSPPYLLVDAEDAFVAGGQDATFFVNAGGEAPLGYLWYRNGVALVDEFSTNLVLSAVTPALTNNTYYVVVTNAQGAITSSVVTLSLVSPPVITNQPVSQLVEAGAEARFSVGATGATSRRGTQRVWDFNSNPAGQFETFTVDPRNGYSFGGNWNVTERSYTLNSGALARNSILVFAEQDPGEAVSELRIEARLRMNAVGGAVSADGVSFSFASVNDPAILDPYHLGLFNENQASVTNASTSEGGTRTGLAVAFDYFAGESGDLTGLQAAVNGSVIASASMTPASMLSPYWRSISITMLKDPALADNERILTVKRDGTTLLVATNTWTPMRGRLVIGNRSGGLTAAVGIDDLKLTTVLPSLPLRYQWYFNGAALPSGTNTTLVIPSVTSSRQGTYEVEVINTAGSVISDAVELSAPVAPLAVGITPSRTNATPGSTVTLSAVVAGTEPFGFQWYHGDIAVEGATNSTLVLTDLPPEAAGFYTFLVTNIHGAAPISSPAEIRVINLPYIESGPEDVVALPGRSTGFSVSVRGTGPFTYQWMFGGEPISYATSSNYTILKPTASNIGDYTVAVANLEGSVLSSPAHLRFADLPKVTQQPAEVAVAPGGVAVFNVGVQSDFPVRYQWQQNGAPIAGETNLSLQIQLPDRVVGWDYAYSVVVTSDAGWVSSQTAHLKVQRQTQIVAGNSRLVRQTIGLRPGWNAVYLTVQPTNNAVEAVLEGTQWTSVWFWKDRENPVEFIQDLSESRWNEPDWLVHFRTNRVESFQNNLARLFSNQAYLIHLDESATATSFDVWGEPSLPQRSWRPDSYNLTGLPIENGVTPSAKDYFEFSPAHYDSTAASIKPIYALSADGHWTLLSNASTLQAGEAYWFYVRGGSTYLGPVEISLPHGRGLLFTREVDAIPVTLINRSPVPRTVMLTPHPIYSGQFPLMIREVTDQGSGYVEMGANYTIQLAARESKIVTFAADRVRVPAAGFESVMVCSDNLGLGIQLPVVVEHRVEATEVAGVAKPLMTGLWVGQANLDAVSEVNSITVITNRLRWTNELGQLTNAVVLSYTNTPNENPTPVPGSFAQRIAFHVDTNGVVRLLSEVYQLMRPATTRTDSDGYKIEDEPAQLVLVTHRSRISDFTGSRLRDGTLAGRRISCPSFTFEGDGATNNFVVCSGSFGSGGTVTVGFGLTPDHPMNPFKHKYHPDHDNLSADFRLYKEEAYSIFREVTLEFDDQGAGAKPAAGYTEVQGIYRERFRGLHRNPIMTSGRFVLRRISTIGELNPSTR